MDEITFEQKIDNLLSDNFSKEKLISFIKEREKLAFISARVPFSFMGMKVNNPKIAYMYNTVDDYINTPD